MTNKIKEHYIEEAKVLGDSKQSTMRDVNIRDKEVEKIIECLRTLKGSFDNPKILEIGCGNGYTAEQIVNLLNVNSLTCIDFCEDLIEIAKKRDLKNVVFKNGDVLNLDFGNNSFDIVFCERCLINMDSWEKQQKALNEIWRVLKGDGVFIMIECFTDGLNNLNEAREAVGLDAIPQPFHNLFFDKEKFLEFINGKFKRTCVDSQNLALQFSENFLSSYYFGSRALYPALVAGKKELLYNNKFVEFFKYLPPYGNYGSIQLFILRKTN